MPVHDWTRVADGTFHDFHVTWIPLLKNVLNQGILPRGYYAMAEQVAGITPDVLTLQAVDDEPTHSESSIEGDGGTALAVSRPRTSVIARLETERAFYADRANHIVIHHLSNDRVVAILEVVSAGNKSNQAVLDKFVRKVTEALWDNIHVSIIDLHPPTSRDPNGIHGAIWGALGGEDYRRPPEKPLTLAAYSALSSDTQIEAYVEPIAVGDTLPDLPLFLMPGAHVSVPLEESYMTAFSQVPLRARRPLETQKA
jgi:hypothetical protein